MWRPVLLINGFIMIVLGAMMFVPAVAAHYYTGQADMRFLYCAMVTMLLGGLLFLFNAGEVKKISVLQGYLMTVSCWFLMPVAAALPFYHNGDIQTVVDAFFESVSGLTSTGSTILTDVERQPVSVLLWRAMLNSLGGIGIVIFAVALTPFLGTGGMQLFNKENSDTEEKFLPKIRYIANDIILTYLILNLVCAAGLRLLGGLPWFDTITLTMSTVSIGGFSIKNDSIASYNSAVVELIIAIFMILCSLPFTYFILIARKKSLEVLTKNPQVRTFFKVMVFYVAAVTAYFSATHHVSLTEAFRKTAFNTIAGMTTAGLSNNNFVQWGQWTVIVFLILYMTGGCTGSTAGSIKIFRWQVVAAFLKKNALKSLSPHQVTVMKIGDKVIGDDIAASVFALLLSFFGVTILATLILSLTGVDFITSLGTVAGSITNAGAGLTDATGPMGNYAGFTPFAKSLLATIMIIGRLEAVTVLVLWYKIR